MNKKIKYTFYGLMASVAIVAASSQSFADNETVTAVLCKNQTNDALVVRDNRTDKTVSADAIKKDVLTKITLSRENFVTSPWTQDPYGCIIVGEIKKGSKVSIIYATDKHIGLDSLPLWTKSFDEELSPRESQPYLSTDGKYKFRIRVAAKTSETVNGDYEKIIDVTGLTLLDPK